MWLVNYSRIKPFIKIILLIAILPSPAINASTSSSSSNSSSSSSFNCPEQFGYFEDKNDCSKYFVCVFGDPLHESCTGGLYFSSELQTCDWPRNVMCASNGTKNHNYQDAELTISIGDDAGFPDQQPPASVSESTSTFLSPNPSSVPFEGSRLSDLQLSRSNLNKNFVSSNRYNSPERGSDAVRVEVPQTPRATSIGSSSGPLKLSDSTIKHDNRNENVDSDLSRIVPTDEELIDESLAGWKYDDDAINKDERQDSERKVEAQLDLINSPPSSPSWDTRIEELLQDRYFQRVNPTSSTPSSIYSSSRSSQLNRLPKRNYDMTAKEHQIRNPLYVRRNATSFASPYRPYLSSFTVPANAPSSLEPYRAPTGDTDRTTFDDALESDQNDSNESPYLPPYAGFESRRQPSSNWSNRQLNPRHLRQNRANSLPSPVESPWNFPTTDLTRNSNNANNNNNNNNNDNLNRAALVQDQPVESEKDSIDGSRNSNLDFHQPTSYDQESVANLPAGDQEFNLTASAKYDLQRKPNFDSAVAVEDTSNRDVVAGGLSGDFIKNNQDPNSRQNYRVNSLLLDSSSGSEVTSEHRQPFELVDYEDDIGDQVPAKRRPSSVITETPEYRPVTSKPTIHGTRPSTILLPNNDTIRLDRSKPIRAHPAAIPVSPKSSTAQNPNPLPPIVSEPLKPAIKCNPRVCQLPNCNCGSSLIPGGLSPDQVPQIITISFEDAINDLNWNIYDEIFDNKRKNPNGCSILGTFYVSHEWTDYGHVQTLYSRGHEIASHGITHSFGEKFSKSRWLKEIQGQREILNRYAAVRLEDVRGMRAPFLQIGGNNMFQMLYEANFTYDSSMPVFDNNPPFWPYTLDYAINHECMITPCPTDSFPGVWEVGLVMWEDLRGGRCSMGDACSNPSDENAVYSLLMKNFERHYNSNRAPFGLYYHSAWFNTAHHRKGFMKFIDQVLSYGDVYFTTKWQMLQWMKNPTPTNQLRDFYPWECKHLIANRPPPCNHPNVCNVRGQHGHRFMKTCQECPNFYPWLGKTGFSNLKEEKVFQ